MSEQPATESPRSSPPGPMFDRYGMTREQWIRVARNDLRFILVVIGAFFAFLAYFIWPTPYFYEKVTHKQGQTTTEVLLRVNRMTGASIRVASSSPFESAQLGGNIPDAEIESAIAKANNNNSVGDSPVQAEEKRKMLQLLDAAEAQLIAEENQRRAAKGLKELQEKANQYDQQLKQEKQFKEQQNRAADQDTIKLSNQPFPEDKYKGLDGILRLLEDTKNADAARKAAQQKKQ